VQVRLAVRNCAALAVRGVQSFLEPAAQAVRRQAQRDEARQHAVAAQQVAAAEQRALRVRCPFLQGDRRWQHSRRTSPRLILTQQFEATLT
jgi:hypothetical protein